MPDLSLKACHEFWKNYNDPDVYRVVAFMESVEDWTIDGNQELERAIDRLGQVLDKTGSIDLQSEDTIIKICTYLKASRTLRLLQCLDTAHPGAASKILNYAEKKTISKDDVYGLFLRRNVVFERLRLLQRVFSNKRFGIILKALEECEGED